MNETTDPNDHYKMKTSSIYNECGKLMRLGLTNRIVNNLDSKPANFDRRFWSDSKSNDESELAIAISI